MSQTLQEKNKTLLLEGFDVLFNKRDFIGAEKYWSPNYIQHSSHIEPGRDGLFNLVKSLPAGSKWEHGIMMAEGDYVMVHSRYTNPDGSLKTHRLSVARPLDESPPPHDASVTKLRASVARRPIRSISPIPLPVPRGP